MSTSPIDLLFLEPPPAQVARGAAGMGKGAQFRPVLNPRRPELNSRRARLKRAHLSVRPLTSSRSASLWSCALAMASAPRFWRGGLGGLGGCRVAINNWPEIRLEAGLTQALRHEIPRNSKKSNHCKRDQ